jgi:hypothetical protein
MQNFREIPQKPELSNQQLSQYYQGLISFIRSRLNVINASFYLFQTSDHIKDNYGNRHLLKINKELETIRKILNEQDHGIKI